MLDAVDVENLHRVGQLRKSLQPRVGEEKRLQMRRQFGQFLELRALANAQRRKGRGQLADALERAAAVQAQLLETFGQSVDRDDVRGVIQIELAQTRRQSRKTGETHAVIEHEALQSGRQAVGQRRERGGPVEIDDLDAVRQSLAGIHHAAATANSQRLHRWRYRRQLRQPVLLVKAQAIRVGGKELCKCFISVQIVVLVRF